MSNLSQAIFLHILKYEQRHCNEYRVSDLDRRHCINLDRDIDIFFDFYWAWEWGKMMNARRLTVVVKELSTSLFFEVEISSIFSISQAAILQ